MSLFSRLSIPGTATIVFALFALFGCAKTTSTPTLMAPDTSAWLDTSFNGTGIVTTTIGTGTDTANAVAIQTISSVDYIVVAGSSLNGANFDFTVARYNMDGSLDTGFNSGGTTPGIVRVDLQSTLLNTNAATADNAYALAIQGDGKILVAGATHNNTTTYNQFALLRLNTDGSLDTSFGTNGVVATAVGSTNATAYAIAIQTGKIVVAGVANDGTTDNFAVAQYSITNGALDTTFNATGAVPGTVMVDIVSTFSGGTAVADTARAVAIDGSGNIVVAGTSGSNAAVVRLDSTGALDATFGNGTTPNGVTLLSGLSAANALALQGANVVVAGAGTGTAPGFALARLLGASGMPDNSFGSGGVVTTSFLPDMAAAAFSITIDGSGRLVVGGATLVNLSYVFAIARYSGTDGSLDSTFGAGGMVTTAVGTLSDNVTGVAIDGNGKIVAAGATWGSSHWTIALARYYPYLPWP